MIKIKKTQREISIDLTGPQGNVFFLISYAKRLSKQIGLDPIKVTEEMMNGDYEHAVQTFDKYFGSVITLYR